jgi:hypothetical protein
MVQILGVVAILSLSVTLVSTIVTIWMERPSAAQFLELTRALLDWKVIAAGLAIGATSAFSSEIKAMLNRFAK